MRLAPDREAEIVSERIHGIRRAGVADLRKTRIALRHAFGTLDHDLASGTQRGRGERHGDAVVAVRRDAAAAHGTAAHGHGVVVDHHLDAEAAVLRADGLGPVALLVAQAADTRSSDVPSAAAARGRERRERGRGSASRRTRTPAAGAGPPSRCPPRTRGPHRPAQGLRITAVSACFERVRMLRTHTSPAVAPATSSMAAALQSPSISIVAGA